MKKRKSLKKRALPQVQWPFAGVNAPRATLVGSNRVLIENHRGIMEFTAERVRLASRDGDILLEGSDLTLAQAYGSSLIVEGCVAQVTMPKGGDGDA